MQIFDQGKPLRFGLIVERLNDIGVRLHTDLGIISGAAGQTELWYFERPYSDQQSDFISWPVTDFEDTMTRTEQYALAVRLRLNPNEQNRVFGWMRI